jgi:hypothetical protein
MAYLIAGLVIISATLVALSYINRSGKQSLELSQASAAEIISQSDGIRSQIMKCGLIYPSGDNGTSLSVGSRKRYPRADSETELASLICPGNGENIWNGVNGLQAPAQILYMGGWKLVNDATNLRLTITGQEAVGAAAIERAQRRIGNLVSSYSGSTLTIVLSN